MAASAERRAEGGGRRAEGGGRRAEGGGRRAKGEGARQLQPLRSGPAQQPNPTDLTSPDSPRCTPARSPIAQEARQARSRGR